MCYVRAVARAVRSPKKHDTRSGTVAIVGRPNVGKSTFLNAALGVPLAIVSRTPQTTRDALLGVVHRRIDDGDDAELLLLDTPGLHKGKDALDRHMNRAARGAARGADVVVFLTDLPREGGAAPLRPHAGDVALLADLGEGVPTVLVVNKVDRLRDKSALLPLLEALAKLRPFAAIVPISALEEDGVDRVLVEVAKLLPRAPHRYGPDELTDRPSRFFASEYVREQILLRARQEVPHAVAVSVDAFEEVPGGFRVAATIHVDRPGHKKILVGARGAMLKQIGTEARKRLAALVGQKVHLELFVRVTPGWRERPELLGELGYAEGDRSKRPS
jgi:GTP-binding protein Era